MYQLNKSIIPKRMILLAWVCFYKRNIFFQNFPRTFLGTRQCHVLKKNSNKNATVASTYMTKFIFAIQAKDPTRTGACSLSWLLQVEWSNGTIYPSGKYSRMIDMSSSIADKESHPDSIQYSIIGMTNFAK